MKLMATIAASEIAAGSAGSTGHPGRAMAA
jgi:hypothetical protein